jgi:deoxycytidylate deaminase
MPDYSDCPALHAEANALSVCERSVREGGTIYITSNVCWNCAKLIANSGLKRVVVRVDAKFKYRNDETSCEFLEQCGLKVDLT